MLTYILFNALYHENMFLTDLSTTLQANQIITVPNQYELDFTISDKTMFVVMVFFYDVHILIITS